jgi:hypothetical protein
MSYLISIVLLLSGLPAFAELTPGQTVALPIKEFQSYMNEHDSIVWATNAGEMRVTRFNSDTEQMVTADQNGKVLRAERPEVYPWQEKYYADSKLLEYWSPGKVEIFDMNTNEKWVIDFPADQGKCCMGEGTSEIFKSNGRDLLRVHYRQVVDKVMTTYIAIWDFRANKKVMEIQIPDNWLVKSTTFEENGKTYLTIGYRFYTDLEHPRERLTATTYDLSDGSIVASKSEAGCYAFHFPSKPSVIDGKKYFAVTSLGACAFQDKSDSRFDFPQAILLLDPMTLQIHKQILINIPGCINCVNMLDYVDDKGSGPFAWLSVGPSLFQSFAINLNTGKMKEVPLTNKFFRVGNRVLGVNVEFDSHHSDVLKSFSLHDAFSGKKLSEYKSVPSSMLSGRHGVAGGKIYSTGNTEGKNSDGTHWYNLILSRLF